MDHGQFIDDCIIFSPKGYHAVEFVDSVLEKKAMNSVMFKLSS